MARRRLQCGGYVLIVANVEQMHMYDAVTEEEMEKLPQFGI